MKTCKVLIVNDHYSSRFLLKEICSSLKMNTVMAVDGKDAIDKLKAEPDISVVFMDIEMPVMNGFETTIYIRTQMPEPICNLPIIAVTAHNIKHFYNEYHKVSFDAVIMKPYSVVKIKEVIKSICQSME